MLLLYSFKKKKKSFSVCFKSVLQRDPSFPLIDSSSQNQIRRRIVLEKLSKVLPGLLGPLQITMGDIYTELKNLIQTFRLVLMV